MAGLRMTTLRCLAVCLLLMGLAAPVGASAAAGSEIVPDPSVRRTVLKNGLVVLTKELRAAPVVTVWTWYRVGSRNELPGMTGLSHLLEHMLFRSTSTMKTGDLDRMVARAGGKHNAFTSFDHTAYHITVPRDHLETALRIEADRMLNCVLDPAEIAKEQGVVLSELQGRHNDPDEMLEDVTRSIALRVHPYRAPIIGWKSDVQAITPEAVRGYYQTFYQPNNAVLVMVGDFQTDTALALVEKYFGLLPAAPPPPPVIPREPPQQGERRAVVKGGGTTNMLQFFYHLPPARHPDQYALHVLDSILTEGKSSRLHRGLVEPELAASVSSFLSRRVGAGWIAFYLTARDGVSHDKLEQAFLEHIERVQTQPASDFEVQKAVNRLRAELTETYGSITGLAEALGTFEMTVGYQEFGQYMGRLRQVTPADVLRVAREYLTADNRTVGWYVATGSTAEGSGQGGGLRHLSHRSDHWPESTPGTPQTSETTPASSVDSHPVAVRTVLSNGLTLIVVENRSVPSIAVTGYVLAAPIHDPPGKAGLAHLTANLLTQGTPSTPAHVLADTLEFLGASLSFQSDYQTISITARTLSEHFDIVLDNLADCLRNPAFQPAEVSRAIGRLRSRLKRDAEDIKDRAHRELFMRLFPAGHPLHRHPRGLIPDLDRIGREDISAFHARFYRPERTVLVLVGDITQDRALAAVQRAFGAWPRLTASVDETIPAMPPVPGMIQHRVELPGKSEAFAMLGGSGISRMHPDYYATLLATRVLGWGMTSRLMSAVREKAGMTYSIWSYFHPFRFERPFVIQFQADPAAMDRALSLVVGVTRQFCEVGSTPEELADAKASLIGSLILSMEDQMGQALVYRDTELYGLGLDYPQRLAAIINGITLEQVNAAAKKYLRPDHLVQVVVTPPPKS